MGNPFYEIAALMLVAAAAGAVAVRLRQPLVIAFILVGIVSGPAILGFTEAVDEITLLAELGMTVLLFLVGLKLDLRLIRNLGPVALATGLGQLTFTIIFGFAITLLLGLDPLPALYVAVALTFSSTVIIVKLLSDKREIDSLHGRIAMGFLIVQDIAVVIAMAVLGTTTVGTEGPGPDSPLTLGMAAAVGALGLALLMRFVLPAVVHSLARSQELLLVFAVAWGVFLAAVGDAMGLSKEIGAFVAGFSLASTDYREAMTARMASLRDFLLLFFFIHLGSQLQFVAPGQTLTRAIVLSLFILIGNPLIVMVIMGALSYRKRTGFLAGLTVAQISEFSLIFIAMGVAVGHIAEEVMGLVTVVGVITITASTYLILYSHNLYRLFERWLGVFERKSLHREEETLARLRQERHPDVVVWGLGRYGRVLARRLHERGHVVLGVDFDPQNVRACRQEGLWADFGDAGDPEFPATLPLASARWVVSTLPLAEVNSVLVDAVRKHGFRGDIALTAHSAADAERMKEMGATRVLRPFRDAAAFAAELIDGHLDAPDDDSEPQDYRVDLDEG